MSAAAPRSGSATERAIASDAVESVRQNVTGGSAERGAFECEICLEEPTEPVVTFCGHLYCWPCLWRWLRSGHSVCPVCKSGVTQDSIIPLYGRGKERVDPRTRGEPGRAGGEADEGGGAGAAAGGAGAEGEVSTAPGRPAGQRSAPPAAGEVWPGGVGGPPLHFAAGFGFFPSLFGLQFTAVTNGRAGAPPDPHMRFLDRVVLSLAAVVITFLLFL
jgi:hypothetical protein